MVKLKVRRVGNSLGVTIPAEVGRALRVREGDSLYLTEAPGGYWLTSYDPGFEETMRLAEGFMARYRSALFELAR